VGFAVSLNVIWFYAGFLASTLLSWVAGLAVQKRRQTIASSPDASSPQK
jgi:hypothetical protein